MEPLLTVKEVAAFLNVAPMTVYRAVKSGALAHVRVGGSIRITREALDAYVVTPEPRKREPEIPHSPVTRI